MRDGRRAINGTHLLLGAAVLALLAFGCNYYQPLDDVRSDGEAAALVVTTPYLPLGQGDCAIYPYHYYGQCAHPAWDIGSSNGGSWIENQPVRTVQAGTIVAVDPDAYCGRDVFVDHGTGVVTRYCHLNSFADIWVGKVVAAREVVGYLGGTYGYVPHLHFEARAGGIDGDYIDLGNPLDWPTAVGSSTP